MPTTEASFLDGEPTALRVWGADAVHRLPDIAAIVSPDAATLERSPDGWVMRATGSEIRADGTRHQAILLEPGLELQVGGVVLVAEGPRGIALRCFVARLLGWGSPAIDPALRALRLAATGRAPLVLCGPGDMIAVARAIHQRALGSAAPFVACDPRRLDVAANVRSAGNANTGLAALRRARGGSMCVWSRRLPSDFPAVRAALRDPSIGVQLIVCAEPRHRKPYHVEPITIPALASRPGDVPRIIDEYASEAAERAGAALVQDDRDWIARAAATIPEIERAVERLLEVRRNAGNTAAAARALGMEPPSLARWLDRRAVMRTRRADRMARVEPAQITAIAQRSPIV